MKIILSNQKANRATRHQAGVGARSPQCAALNGNGFGKWPSSESRLGNDSGCSDRTAGGNACHGQRSSDPGVEVVPAWVWRRVAVLAFTLIELLVVIAIIALLAAMVIPITGAVQKSKIRSTCRAQLHQITGAIDAYKVKLGHYPPTDTNNPAVNPLYYELKGTVVNPNGNIFSTLDGSAAITNSSISAIYGANISGFVNSTRGGGDEGSVAADFLKGVKNGQYLINPDGFADNAVFLGTQSDGPLMFTRTNKPPPAKLNPWRYNSVNPTNNPNTYDLWIDVLVGGKTNRICNWSDNYIVL